MKKIYIRQMEQMSKIKLNNRFVCHLASHDFSQNILEIGAGNRSTFIIRNALMGKNSGYCLSLENNILYYKSLTTKLPNNKFGEIQFSNLIYDKVRGAIYDYVFFDKYDFIYIDGPGNCDCIDKNGKIRVANEEIIKFLSSSNVWLGDDRISSAGRMFIFDYIQSCSHKDTIVMVDSSAKAMLYYYQQYRKTHSFVGFGLPTSEKKINRYIKPEYHNLLKKIGYSPRKVNIIYRKDSEKAPIIINEVLARVLSSK